MSRDRFVTVDFRGNDICRYSTTSKASISTKLQIRDCGPLDGFKGSFEIFELFRHSYSLALGNWIVSQALTAVGFD